MDFFEVVKKRRSIRRYTDKAVPDTVIEKALEAALLAPNSSNIQSWNFYWVKTPDKKKKLIEACLNQSAARTAQHLIVATADPKLWKRSQPHLIRWVEDAKAPKLVQDYYKKLIPLTYSWGFLNCYAPFKWLMATVYGFFKPTLRGPYTRRDIQEVASKSAALACENFVLAITAQGFASCMMEGNDKVRIKKLLNLKHNERVVMVISVGEESDRGTWGPQSRLQYQEVVHTI